MISSFICVLTLTAGTHTIPPAKFALEIPKAFPYEMVSSQHVVFQKTGNEVSTIMWQSKDQKNMLSVAIGYNRTPPPTYQGDVAISEQNDRRGFPSEISIGESGYTPEGRKNSLLTRLQSKNVSVAVSVRHPRVVVNGQTRFDLSSWDKDMPLAENMARRAMSIAMLWHYAGVDGKPDEQRVALIEAGYSRLGPWMTQKGFETQFDNMLRVATFTKGNQKIKLAEGSREGFDGTVRKDHGSLIIGFQGELWAKTSQLNSWIN